MPSVTDPTYELLITLTRFLCHQNAGNVAFSNIIDREKQWTRSYAATAYYLPKKDQPNFKVSFDFDL